MADYLTTNFSPSMLDAGTDKWDIYTDKLTVTEARAFVLDTPTDIRIANPYMARLVRLALTLPFEVPLVRTRLNLFHGDRMLLAAYRGPRIEEDGDLPRPDTLTFWMMEMNDERRT